MGMPAKGENKEQLIRELVEKLCLATGRSGLQELLEEVVGEEEEALYMLYKLSKMLGGLSPYRGDSVVVPLDERGRFFAVADFRRLLLRRARKVGARLVYKERVLAACPTRVVVYEGPGKTRKYEVTFERRALRQPLVVGPATLNEIVAVLRADALVLNRRLVKRTLAAILNAFIEGGRAEVRSEAQPDSDAGSPPEG